MKLPKFLSLIAFITCLSLFYVYQQTEIFRFAYVGQKKMASLEDLVDKNSILRYNIGKNASLVHIGNKISKPSEFQMPDSYRLVKLRPAKMDIQVNTQQPLTRKENIFSRLVGVKRQAEAKTINP